MMELTHEIGSVGGRWAEVQVGGLAVVWRAIDCTHAIRTDSYADFLILKWKTCILKLKRNPPYESTLDSVCTFLYCS